MIRRWALRFLSLLRIVSFAVGVGLVILAQMVFVDSDFITPVPIAQPLNLTFHLDMSIVDNVILGVMLLIAGALCLVWAFRGLAIPDTGADKPPSLLARLPKLSRGDIGLLLLTLGLFALLIFQLHSLDTSDSLVLLWAIVLILLGAVAYRIDRRNDVALSLDLTRYDLGILVGLLVLGLIIGTYALGTLPNTFIGDEMAFLTQAKAIATGRIGVSFFGYGVYTFPVAGIYYQGAIMRIFGPSVWSWRFGSVLISWLAVIPTYLLSHALFNRRVATLTGAIMITLPYFLSFARLGYNNSQAILPVALCLYFLYLGLQRSSVFYLTLSGIAGGLGWYTYSASRFGLVVGLSFLGLTWIGQFIKRRRSSDTERQDNSGRLRWLTMSGIVFVIVAALTIAPVYVFENTEDSAQMRSKTLETIFPNIDYALSIYSKDDLYRDHPPIQMDDQHTLFFRPDLYADLLVRGLFRSVMAFHIGRGLMEDHYTVAPLTGPFSVVFYFIGLVFALTRIRRREFQLIVLWLGILVLVLSVVATFPPRPEHLIVVIPALSMLSAVGIVACAEFIHTKLRFPNILTNVLVLVCVGAIAAAGLVNYFVQVPLYNVPNVPLDVIVANSLPVTQPQNMIFVTDDSNQADHDIDWLALFPTQVIYQRIDSRTLLTNTFQIKESGAITFYFSDADKDWVLPILAQRYNHGAEIVPHKYLTREDRIVILSWTVNATANQPSFTEF